MMTLEKYQHPEVVDWQEVKKYKKDVAGCQLPVASQALPTEVIQFIEVMDKKLGDFAQAGKEKVPISGHELLLCGITEWYKEPVDAASFYVLDVPKMFAVNYSATMHRLFKRKGKRGLIEFCKAKVKATELEKILDILTVEVFHEQRAEFRNMLSQIEASKKLELVISA